MQNVNLVTTIKMISYKTDKAGRIVLPCPLMDARVTYNTACIKEIDAILWFNSFLSKDHRDELAQRRERLVNKNKELYRSAGW